MASRAATSFLRHPRKRGDASRQRIVSLLLERKTSGAGAPTLDELHQLVGGSLSNLRHHLEWLESRNIVRVQGALREVTRHEIVLLDAQSSTTSPNGVA